MFGSKNIGRIGIFGSKHTSASFSGQKLTMASNRVAMIDKAIGRGDTGGGEQVHGNTHNPVANAQRDGAPNEMRTGKMPGKRSSTSNKLESKKKNKST